MNARSVWCWVLLFCLPVAGCSLFSESGKAARRLANKDEKEAGSTDVKQVANPPARTIRFDGHEVVLGNAESTSLETEQLITLLNPPIAQQRWRSAGALIERHRDTSERLLLERWALSPEDPTVRIAADVLSRRSGAPQTNWNSLLQLAQVRPDAARPYQEARNAFAKEMQTGDPSEEKVTQLQQLSQSVGHPLVQIDCLRLLGLRELVAERTAWAESLCRQAVEVATASEHTAAAAELWLMVADTARRSDQPKQAEEAWSKAVTLYMTSLAHDQPVDASFWLQAENVRPATAPWPTELTHKLSPHLGSVGCTVDGGAEMVLWAAVAQAQLERGEMQSALVNFKRAETLATGNNVMWLRIAQSRCLAAMGQVPAAAAILSTPASSSEPSVAAAATAAMGSTKLQAGAYQQGAQLLNKALMQAPTVQWPGKNQALADLALAQLIIGDATPGLEALHAAQAEFAAAGAHMLLIRSLDNEVRLLQHERRDAEAAAISARILELERF